MQMPDKSVSDDVKGDREFVLLVLSGDERACREFVENHTDRVLFKVWGLMKTHCNYTARDFVCTLVLLQRKRKGAAISLDDGAQCDECMDSYIWFFEHLKKKLKSYKGINDCRLNTYVWSIINSHSIVRGLAEVEVWKGVLAPALDYG